MTIVTKVEGPIPAAELLNGIGRVVAAEEPELVVARHEKEQRNQNQEIRKQQDEAFLESLRIDREKAKKKQEEEEAKRKAEELERKKQQDEEDYQNVKS
jgi:FAS-associated factor 2